MLEIGLSASRTKLYVQVVECDHNQDDHVPSPVIREVHENCWSDDLRGKLSQKYPDQAPILHALATLLDLGSGVAASFSVSKTIGHAFGLPMGHYHTFDIWINNQASFGKRKSAKKIRTRRR